jgi:DNA-binding response OmpR family regulator
MPETPPKTRSKPRPDVQVPEILVVEDEENISVLLRDSLTREGMNVCEVSDVEVAQDKIKSSAPDLLILNMTLPKLSSLELCRSIRFR